MVRKILEKMDDLFVVKQEKSSLKKNLIALAVAFLVFMSLPLHIYYSKVAYSRYTDEYLQAKELTFQYFNEKGEFPIGERVSLQKEKKLMDFLKDNKMNLNRQLYYIDTDRIPELQGYKNTYILDIDNEFIFTSDYVIYQLRRWHYGKRF